MADESHTVVPRSSTLAIVSVPPCSSTSAFASGKPSPVPAKRRVRISCAPLLDLAERLERDRDIFLAHADAGIGDGDHREAASVDRRYRRATARRRELDRIRHRLSKICRKRSASQRMSGKRLGEIDESATPVASAIAATMRRQDSTISSIVDGLVAQLEPAGFDLREIENVVDERFADACRLSWISAP